MKVCPYTFLILFTHTCKSLKPLPYQSCFKCVNEVNCTLLCYVGFFVQLLFNRPIKTLLYRRLLGVFMKVFKQIMFFCELAKKCWFTSACTIKPQAQSHSMSWLFSIIKDMLSGDGSAGRPQPCSWSCALSQFDQGVWYTYTDDTKMPDPPLAIS